MNLTHGLTQFQGKRLVPFVRPNHSDMLTDFIQFPQSMKLTVQERMWGVKGKQNLCLLVLIYEWNLKYNIVSSLLSYFVNLFQYEINLKIGYLVKQQFLLLYYWIFQKGKVMNQISHVYSLIAYYNYMIGKLLGFSQYFL